MKSNKVHDEKVQAEVEASFRKDGEGMAPAVAAAMFPPAAPEKAPGKAVKKSEKKDEE